MSETTGEHLKVGMLKPGFRDVKLIVKVVDVGEPRVTLSRRNRSEHRISDALVGDETGSVLLTLWDDQINIFNPENVFEIQKCYTTLYKGSLRLNLGRYGMIKRVETEIEKVNTENNLSKQRHEGTLWSTPSRRPFKRRRRRP